MRPAALSPSQDVYKRQLPRQKNLIMPFDDGENRKIFELCYRDREKRVNPLAYWTDADIWNYSRDAKLEQCSLYSEGFDRLGCIGCPLAREQNRRREFSRWPKFYEQYLRTFDRMLERRRQCGDAILDYASTAEIWMEWWPVSYTHLTHTGHRHRRKR